MNQSSHGQNQSNESNQNQNQQENLITLLQDQDKYFLHFQQTYKKATNFLKLLKFSQASQYFLKCCEMLQIGKHIFKKLSKYWPICIYLNIAYVYQNDWKIQKTNRYLQKAQQILQTLIKSIDKDNKQQFLNLTLQLVKLKYQHCAVLSQLNLHQKALAVCQSALPLLKQNIQIILVHAKKQYSLSQRQQNEYGVKFGVKVYSFAEQILNNLLAKMKLSCQSSKPSTIKKQSSFQFYYWQKNPQRNQTQLRNTFVPSNQKQQSAKRSILGVTKQKTWIADFNIGCLMKMSPTNLSQWQKSSPLEQYLFKQKIYEYVIYTSVGYFTMATQIRFIDNNKKTTIIDEKIKSKHEEIKKKYGYEEKSEYFALSQSHHLTSISIVTQNIQTLIPYLSHLIKSYDKHYIFKKKLDQIMAIPQQSVLEGSKLSNIRLNSRTVSKASNYGNSIQRQRYQSLEKLEQHQQEYGCSYKTKQKQKMSESQNSDDQYLQEKNTSKSQRKTLNNIYQTYTGMDNSLRHKSPGKMRSVEKLSQTLRPKTKRKNLSQQSINQMRNSLQSIQQKQMKKLTKSKDVTVKKTRDKEKERQKERQKEKEKIGGNKQSQKRKVLKNTIKQKLNLASLEGEGELHVKHKSCTSFKLVFKKKK